MEETKLKDWMKQKIPRMGTCAQCNHPIMQGETFRPKEKDGARVIVHGLCSLEWEGCEITFKDGIMNIKMPGER